MAKKAKQSLLQKLSDHVPETLLLIIMGLIAVIYWDVRGDIAGLEESRDMQRSELTAMRIEFVRFHPEVGLAAYTVASSASDLSVSEMRAVFDVLADRALITERAEAAMRVPRELSKIATLGADQVRNISDAYFRLDPERPENWTAAEVRAMLDGLALGQSPAALRFDAMLADMEPSGFLHYLQDWLPEMVVLLLLLIAVAFAIEWFLKPTDDNSEK